MKEVSPRKHFSILGFVFSAGAILFTGGQYLCIWIFEDWIVDYNTLLIWQLIPVYLISVPLFAYLISLMPKKTVEKHKMRPWQYICSLFCVYGIGIVSNLVGLLVTFLMGLASGHMINNQAVTVISSLNPWVSIVMMVILAPMIEEFLFRKMLITRTIQYGEGISVLLSGLMFGLFHGNLNQFAYAFTVGCFFAFIYVKTGKIWLTISMHAFLNFMGSVVPQFVLKFSGVNEFMEMNSLSQQALEFVSDHLMGILIYLGYAFLISGMVQAGIVLLIVFRRKFRFNKGEIQVPRGQRFKTYFLNPGMIVYVLVWVGMIVYQAIQ